MIGSRRMPHRIPRIGLDVVVANSALLPRRLRQPEEKRRLVSPVAHIHSNSPAAQTLTLALTRHQPSPLHRMFEGRRVDSVLMSPLPPLVAEWGRQRRRPSAQRREIDRARRRKDALTRRRRRRRCAYRSVRERQQQRPIVMPRTKRHRSSRLPRARRRESLDTTPPHRTRQARRQHRTATAEEEPGQLRRRNRVYRPHSSRGAAVSSSARDEGQLRSPPMPHSARLTHTHS